VHDVLAGVSGDRGLACAAGSPASGRR
jgi:hypothetical protein